jgi:hypothetical protein
MSITSFFRGPDMLDDASIPIPLYGRDQMV